ncbi:MAG: flagellar basal body P-ring protein FlgI [Phycisphaerales bacterium]|nr:flagellar basal body P-ring protein FlgI [Phycisphaerales bacterium]
MLSIRANHVLLVAIALGVTGISCSSIESARPRPRASSTVSKIDDTGTLNIMRGTVGAESIMLGYSDANSPAHKPIVVRGYGLVVDLDGTGSSDIPPAVRAHMLEIMERRGVGQMSFNAGGITPNQLLESNNTAVVIVEGVIPPASVGRLSPPTTSSRGTQVVPGTTFDLRVYADPNTGTTSLEGGRLYTTELRPGALMLGSRQATPLAEGKGALFINPFANALRTNNTTVDRLSGRVLSGGEVLKDMPLKVLLTNASHTRARLLQDAINRRFPQESGQRSPTAKGASDTTIELTVPPSMRNRTEEFVQLVKHATLRQANAESVALSTQRALLADTNNAQAAYWRWCAIGERSLPLIRELYTDPENTPRLVALRAGAFLGDPIVAEHLRAMAVDGSLGERLESADLMKTLPADPRTDRTLRTMLNDEDVEVRLRAYEALAARNDPSLSRKPISGKFLLDLVRSDHPMIYVTQSKVPRIAVFGPDLAIDRPITMGAWDNRLMIQNAPENDEKIEIFYRPARGGSTRIVETEANAHDFIEFLAHRTTPDDTRSGLNLSYSDTVGAIHEIWTQGYLKSDFKAEQDRLLASIRRHGTLTTHTDRPDFGPEDEDEATPVDATPMRGPTTVTPLRKQGNDTVSSGS